MSMLTHTGHKIPAPGSSWRRIELGYFPFGNGIGRALKCEQAKQRRIAIIISGGLARIDDPGDRTFRAFWEELRRLGAIEGQNLTVERYFGEGRPKGYADLAREE